jgi:hypothetical protein
MSLTLPVVAAAASAPPTLPAWLALVCGVLVLVAAAYLLYVVLRPEAF